MATRIEDLADPTFDPYLSDELVFGDVADPYPRIAALREQAPVVEGDYRVIMGIPTVPSTPRCRTTRCCRSRPSTRSSTTP